MKAAMGKDIKTILNDSKGKIQLQNFIGSNKSTATIELSNGDTYKIMPANSKDFFDYVEKKSSKKS